MKIRGYVALLVVCLSFPALDLVQRLIVTPWIRLRPARRIAVLSRWERLMAWWVLTAVSWIGGARIPELPRIPAGEGTLVLMNHQSLLDIPLIVASIHGTYPRIITRKRYLRWIPLISHMVRLYQYPVVDPTANAGETKKMLAEIRQTARTADVPLAIFPEGTRTRDGAIGPFKTTGLRMVLRQRPWTVWVMVADGFWERARFRDFMNGVAEIDGQVGLAGPFEWTDPRGDSDAFIDEMRKQMVEGLDALRAPVAV